MIARLDLSVLNSGNTSTFRRPGYRETILDLTLATPNAAITILGWKVLETYNANDHQYIEIVIDQMTSTRHEPGAPPKCKHWNDRKLNEAKLMDFLAKRWSPHTVAEPGEEKRAVTELLVEKTMDIITAACEVAKPSKTDSGKRRPNHWWTAEISELKKKCLGLRRKLVRANRRHEPGLTEILTIEYVKAKKELKSAIKDSKRKSWRKLCSELDNDPWGLAYKIVVKGLGKQSPVPAMQPAVIEGIIADLFPQHLLRTRRAAWDQSEPPLFSIRELQEAAMTLKTGKAPGPDGIPASVIEAIASK